MNPLNNARLEPVTPHFNKVRPTDQSNRGCLGLCSHALKRCSDALKMSEFYKIRLTRTRPLTQPANRQAICSISFQLDRAWLDRGQPCTAVTPFPPRPSSIWSSDTDLIWSIMHHILPFLSGLLPLECPPPTPRGPKTFSLHCSKCNKHIFRESRTHAKAFLNRLVRHLCNIRGPITTVP